MRVKPNAHKEVGDYIRGYLVPCNITTEQAAKVMGVGRPALSMLLNGHVAITPNMAARMEKAFLMHMKEQYRLGLITILMQIQMDLDLEHARKELRRGK